MEKILAIAVLLIFIWLAIPRLVHGQWIAPTAVEPGSWTTQTSALVSPATAGLAEAAGTPSEGFGWFHFDFWNHPSLAGQPATTADLHFRSPSQEFKN
jgi:hypothetical protein